MIFKEIKQIRKVTFRKLEGDYFVCDIEWQKAKRVKRRVNINGKLELKLVTDHPVTKNAKIKLDVANTKLLEKANMLINRDIIYISYNIPACVEEYDIDKWTIVDILDEIDLLEINNRNALFQCKVPVKEKLIQPTRKKTKSKKDIKINELEEENAELRLQIQRFKSLHNEN